MTHVEAAAAIRAFVAVTPAQIRNLFGPCEGTLELLAAHEKVAELVTDFDKFNAADPYGSVECVAHISDSIRSPK